MVVVSKLRGTTNLRLVNKTFDNLVVYCLFKGDHIYKKHILDGNCRKCQIPGSLVTRFLAMKMETVYGQESHLGRVIDEILNRFVQVQRSCGSRELPRSEGRQLLLESVAERLAVGRILKLGEDEMGDTARYWDWPIDPFSTQESEPISHLTGTVKGMITTGGIQASDYYVSHGMMVLAASIGDISALEHNISVVAPLIDSASEYFTTAIHAAARKGQLEAVKLLLKRGARANPSYTLDIVRNTPLGAACAEGHGQMVRLLLEQPVETWSQYTAQIEAAVRLAIRGGHTHLVDMILRVRRDVDDPEFAHLIRTDDVLLIAASCGSEEMVVKMLNAGVNRETFGTREKRAAFQRNALELAAAAGRLNIVKLLIGRGSIRRMHNAFVLATREQRDDVARYLLEEGANINHIAPRPNHWRRRGTALMTASSHADEEMVRYLLAQGVDINALAGGNNENQGSCALTSACRRGHVEIARLLIKAGVDPNKPEWPRGKGGKSNLYYARKSGAPGIVEALVELGAQP